MAAYTPQQEKAATTIQRYWLRHRIRREAARHRGGVASPHHQVGHYPLQAPQVPVGAAGTPGRAMFLFKTDQESGRVTSHARYGRDGTIRTETDYDHEHAGLRPHTHVYTRTVIPQGPEAGQVRIKRGTKTNKGGVRPAADYEDPDLPDLN